MTALAEPPTAVTDDHFGAIETAGVEYLPEDARDSRPRNLGAVFLGANLTWTNVVFGAFAIMFGLSFWQTLSSMAVGIAVGKGATLDEALAGKETVAEGVATTKSALALAEREGVEMPIVSMAHRVLFEGHSAQRGVTDLMSRELRAEQDA